MILLNVGKIDSHPRILWGVSLGLGSAVLVFGGWRKLVSGDSRGPLLSLLFVAEALVWGTVARYSTQTFLTGVYIFHIAAGSYFHYLGSYFFAHAKAPAKSLFANPIFILGVNVVLVGLGYLACHAASLTWLTPVLGIQWFTLWVGLHLVSSDVFPLLKKRPATLNQASQA